MWKNRKRERKMAKESMGNEWDGQRTGYSCEQVRGGA
jgi:hypothetical protein